MLIVIPLFYALAWALAYNFVDGVGALSVRECLMRGWTGSEGPPILVNHIALGAALLAYILSWVVRLWRPKNKVL